MPIWKGKTYFSCAAQKKIFHVFDLVAFGSCTTTKRPFGSAFAVSKYREEATTAEEECQLVPFSLLLRVYRVGWNCDIGTTRKKWLLPSARHQLIVTVTASSDGHYFSNVAI